MPQNAEHVMLWNTVPAARSFFSDEVNGAEPNTRSSPATGATPPDQLPPFDQFSLTAPVHVFVAAKRADGTRTASRQRAHFIGSRAGRCSLSPTYSIMRAAWQNKDTTSSSSAAVRAATSPASAPG